MSLKVDKILFSLIFHMSEKKKENWKSSKQLIDNYLKVFLWANTWCVFIDFMIIILFVVVVAAIWWWTYLSHTFVVWKHKPASVIIEWADVKNDETSYTCHSHTSHTRAYKVDRHAYRKVVSLFLFCITCRF